jgi:hypothetical protein
LQRPVVLLARVLGFVDSRYLVSGKDIYFPELVRSLGDRFSFQKSPAVFEEFDISKGVEFVEGRSGRRTIQKFVIWDNSLVIETTSSTKDAKEILEEMLLWAVDKFGINYKPNSISRYAYVSDVTFESDSQLLTVSSALSSLAKSCTSVLTEIWQEPVEYRPISLKLGHDPTMRKFGIAPFSIERRGTARFSENRYFSEAPLPTDVHFQMLEEFEKLVVGPANIT